MKAHRSLDCRGMLCPMPPVKPSKAMKRLRAGEILAVIADVECFHLDVKAWCEAMGNPLLGLKHVGRVKDLGTKELAERLFSDKPVEAALGMATLNAILDEPAYCFKGPSAFDLMVDGGRGKRVAVVAPDDPLREISQEATYRDLSGVRKWAWIRRD